MYIIYDLYDPLCYKGYIFAFGKNDEDIELLVGTMNYEANDRYRYGARRVLEEYHINESDHICSTAYIKNCKYLNN